MTPPAPESPPVWRRSRARRTGTSHAWDLGGGVFALPRSARDGGRSTRTLASREVPVPAALRLKIAGNESDYAFSFDWRWAGLATAAGEVDGTVLSTDRAGGFVGALLGPFARDERNGRSK